MIHHSRADFSCEYYTAIFSFNQYDEFKNMKWWMNIQSSLWLNPKSNLKTSIIFLVASLLFNNIYLLSFYLTVSSQNDRKHQV